MTQRRYSDVLKYDRNCNCLSMDTFVFRSVASVPLTFPKGERPFWSKPPAWDLFVNNCFGKVNNLWTRPGPGPVLVITSRCTSQSDTEGRLTVRVGLGDKVAAPAPAEASFCRCG
ncbi:Protein of unknown function [Pyronema omphalodes CBS 100304]|uniref:Uncharacterized protein n=1 Tax=Pyronema omphalodes (strain CBS 100304) TaxID=1076935 RepID=U4LMZ4_PYROM|nr:Protein of unknown function [Pyronema omphalodes CBS 100304]